MGHCACQPSRDGTYEHPVESNIVDLQKSGNLQLPAKFGDSGFLYRKGGFAMHTRTMKKSPLSSDINVTPMADIMLVLLIIFMITTILRRRCI
jgi:hypothetical protein